jgi:carbonic anhydrase
MRPRRKLAVVTCMDARVDPWRLLGLAVGDAHVIRNAGGVVSDDAIRSLSISQHLLGTEEVVLIQHTDCGMRSITDEDFADRLEAEAGRRPGWAAGALSSDLEADVRQAVETIRSSPFIPHTERISGYVYEVETGDLREVPPQDQTVI